MKPPRKEPVSARLLLFFSNGKRLGLDFASLMNLLYAAVAFGLTFRRLACCPSGPLHL